MGRHGAIPLQKAAFGQNSFMTHIVSYQHIKMPGKRPVSKDDPEYLIKRAKNNEAIRKTRERAKAKAKATEDRLAALKADNKCMEDKIQMLNSEMEFLQKIYDSHAETKQELVSTSKEEANSEGQSQNTQEFIDSLFNCDQL